MKAIVDKFYKSAFIASLEKKIATNYLYIIIIKNKLCSKFGQT